MNSILVKYAPPKSFKEAAARRMAGLPRLTKHYIKAAFSILMNWNSLNSDIETKKAALRVKWPDCNFARLPIMLCPENPKNIILFNGFHFLKIRFKENGQIDDTKGVYQVLTVRKFMAYTSDLFAYPDYEILELLEQMPVPTMTIGRGAGAIDVTTPSGRYTNIREIQSEQVFLGPQNSEISLSQWLAFLGCYPGVYINDTAVTVAIRKGGLKITRHKGQSPARLIAMFLTGLFAEENRICVSRSERDNSIIAYPVLGAQLTEGWLKYGGAPEWLLSKLFLSDVRLHFRYFQYDLSKYKPYKIGVVDTEYAKDARASLTIESKREDAAEMLEMAESFYYRGLKRLELSLNSLDKLK